MRLLNDYEVNADPSQLVRAWEGSDTFALLPGKSGGADDWIESALRSLPAQHLTGRFLLLTSGSTGDPKLIVGLRERSERLVRVLHELQESEAVTETIVALPLTYSYAFVNQWLWSHVMGRKLVITHGFRQPDALKVSLQQSRNAMLCLVGIQGSAVRSVLRQRTISWSDTCSFCRREGFRRSSCTLSRVIFPDAKVFQQLRLCRGTCRDSPLRPAEDAQEAANIGRPPPGISLQYKRRSFSA